MAEAAVEPRRHVYRFFCHRCNVEFEDVVQDYTCPYCATGFIERLEHQRDGDSFVSALEDEEYSDADMSNLEETSHLEDSIEDSLDDLTRANAQGQPMLNDLAFLMTGGRLRPAGARRGESRTLMEQLVWMIGGGRGGATVTAGAPFVLVGAPGDYVFGGEGLDAVVTQLLGQLENTGPPPLPRDQIQAIPNKQITAAQVEANMSCSVCWDNFTLEETVSRLECEHIFHPACITPWLQLHATCPICRRSLLTAEQQQQQQQQHQQHQQQMAEGHAELIISSPASSSSTTTTQTDGGTTPSFSRLVVRRLGGGSRRRRGTQTPGDGSDSSGASAGGLWAQLASHLASADSAASRASDRDAAYMDIDYD